MAYLDDLLTWLATLPPFLRPTFFRNNVMPMGETKFNDLRNQNLIDVVYIDGMPFVVTQSVIKLVQQSPTTPDPKSRESAARARAGTAAKAIKVATT